MKIQAYTITVLTISALVCGCNQRTKVATTNCEQMGKTSDAKFDAELKQKCGHGGPEFKPTPKTRTF